ncbi:hypothetical protein OBBRIDRAFT_839673 [Obba rivulosa]|uniref:Uncharacterized protein n=1 Tax=Obba rivulosa TaxID=1052685 RepID=A0A8E2AHW6_9APHY|nr:hypothetical protein OBBRIDRAFT_839673 [Obba rivulosa]
MVDWTSTVVEAKDGEVWDRLMHAMFGLYVWELVISMNFDLDYIRGKRRFRWPLIFYFANRYSLLFSYIGIRVDCQALYTYTDLFGNMSVGFVSINLSLRTMAVWRMSLYVVVPLVLLILGHWSLLLHGLVKAEWIDGMGCAITRTENTILAASFIYAMCLDLIVLALTAWGLTYQTGHRASSPIASLIFKDGLIYFIIAFFADLVAVIFMLMNLSPIMSVIANVPVATLTTVVACRVVRRLANYSHGEVEILGRAPLFDSNASGPIIPITDKHPDGVHIQVEPALHPHLTA